ncbi:MAG TPA: hypothetical protein VJX74_08660 [Blastocatellia bacterium]|nr:hypothetical protein [Blastocatellia bacterium]
MLKKIAVVSMLLVFAFLAAAPEAFAGCRNRRGSYRTAYYGSPYRYRSSGYSPYRYRSSGYRPYRSNSYGYNSYGYSPYRYRSVAGQRYYGRRRHSTRNLILSIAAPGAVGAGVGALLGGKKGAGVGALLGAGGGAAYYLIKNRNRRY